MIIPGKILKIIFVTASGNDIGLGHLRRCLTLANSFSRKETEISFLIISRDPQPPRVIIDSGYSYVQSDYLDKDEYYSSLSKLPESADLVIVDVLYPKFSEECKNTLAFFRKMRSLGRFVVAIDVLDHNSVSKNTDETLLDLIVHPYVSLIAANRSSAGKNLLAGAQYAILPPEYAQMIRRRHRKHANHVLVLSGGSDRDAFTLKILEALENFEPTLDISVIIGPLFSDKLIHQIEDALDSSTNRIKLHNAPENLLSQMLSCDMAISASGLTKYELAATGTPALIFSIDLVHAEINRPFSEKKTAIDIGVGISRDLVASETRKLLSDIELRKQISRSGQELIDGLGTQRLINEIKKVLFC